MPPGQSEDNSSASSAPKPEQRSAAERVGSFNWIAAVLLLFIGYQVYSGVYLQEVGIPPFVLKFDTGRSSVPASEAKTEKTELTRDYIVGRWQTSIQVGQSGGDSMTEYFEDGTFSSTASEFYGSQGARQQFGGTWDFLPLSSTRFRLQMWDDEGDPWEGVFEVLGPNRVQNTSQNYVSNRLSQ